MKKALGRITVISLFAAAAVLGVMGDTPQGPATAYADGTPTPTPTPSNPDCMSTGCGS